MPDMRSRLKSPETEGSVTVKLAFPHSESGSQKAGRADYTEKKPGDKAFVCLVGLQDLGLERELVSGTRIKAERTLRTKSETERLGIRQDIIENL